MSDTQCFGKILGSGGSLGLLKWHPGHNLSKRTIVVMHFQGTPLGGGYYMRESVGRSGLIQGCGRLVGRGWVWVSDARFSVAEYVELGSPISYFLVSLMDSSLLMPRSSQLTSSVSPVSYCLLVPG